jgi:Holliday junction resolvase
MRKRFKIYVSTISVGLIFVFAADILQTAFAQLKLPPGEVLILNETATNTTNYTISNSTNNITEMVKSMKP